ncbi:MAG: type II toxin-antitoxin system HicB family antitoxin [Thermoanaerobaculales bacterium]
MACEYAFAVVLTPDDEAGGYVVTCPDLPEVVTQGEGRADALEQAADAIEEAVAGRLGRGEEIPAPTECGGGGDVVPLAPVTAAKVALEQAMREAGMSQVGLAGLLCCDEKEVRRLLDPRHPSKMPRLARALRLLGKGLIVRVVDRVA